MSVARLADKLALSHLSSKDQFAQLYPPSPAYSHITNGSYHRSSLGSIEERSDSTEEHSMLDQQPLDDVLPQMDIIPSSMSRRPMGSYCLMDFHIHRTLGTGTFGRVHLGEPRHNQRFYAMKVLGKDKVIAMKQVEHTKSERAVLDAVHHPFIVNLWGTFQDSSNLYMVMDFVAGGELFSLLRKSRRFPDPVAKFYAAEVALALHYLHTLNIIYRDLKPENILLASDGHIKITDFGFAKRVEDVTWTLCGTPDYLAPEIITSSPYNKSVDWYALGVLIFEMLAGYPPFYTEDTNPVKLYQKIALGVDTVPFPTALNPLAVDLIKRFMTSDVSERYGNLKHGVNDIFAHGWFAEVRWEKLFRKEITAPYVPKIAGEGDASQFEAYHETPAEYGALAPDPYGHLFPDFEYTWPAVPTL
ncbi:kinase-like protein [Sistotremastrum niveocremeum HHB9708]|uniref:cAMP-dependent protein kinase n=1 Tax=Sistotremastrum niveocremeum HHB9708 TaxID=1314777 RepID=A0A164NIW4_9AGAM|nr:kinase-like protein [Sistotremastrum niveocremeum HHB9708]